MSTDGKKKSLPTIRISTDDIPGARRAWAIREYLGALTQTELTLLEPENEFQYRAELRLLPDVTFGGAFSSANSTRRTKQLLKDGQDDLIFVMAESRVTLQLPNRDDLVVDPGDAFLFSQAREFRMIYHDSAPTWAVRVPHRNMARMLVGLGSAPVLSLRKETPVLDLLRRYRRVIDGEALEHEMEQEIASRHLQEIIAAAIRHSDGYRREAETNSLTAVRLRAMKDDIAANLGNIGLDLNWLAARQKVTPRYVQKLFELDGTSFSQHLRQARLARVYSMLVDPRFNDRTINAIAHECGFPEASTMNRAFRREYGMTPSDLRGRN